MTERERTEWSVPERELMAHVRDRLDADEPAMVATVVDVEGSAYRRPGAKMVVSPSKGGVGAITAGCLESEVRQLAEQVLDDGEPTVKTFDLTGDDDVWGFGVGCNGVIDVLLEPLDESIGPAVEAYERGEETTVATVVASDVDGVSVGDRATDGFEDFPDEVEAAIRAADVEKSRTVDVETDAGTVSVFVDRIVPPAELVVIGSGHDVSPIVDLALNVDFRVTVVTFRGADGAKERFPDADRVVATSPRSLTDDVTFDANTYVVVMSHNFIDDRLALEALLETDVAVHRDDGAERALRGDARSVRGGGRRDSVDRTGERVHAGRSRPRRRRAVSGRTQRGRRGVGRSERSERGTPPGGDRKPSTTEPKRSRRGIVPPFRSKMRKRGIERQVEEPAQSDARRAM